MIVAKERSLLFLFFFYQDALEAILDGLSACICSNNCVTNVVSLRDVVACAISWMDEVLDLSLLLITIKISVGYCISYINYLFINVGIVKKKS